MNKQSYKSVTLGVLAGAMLLAGSRSDAQAQGANPVPQTITKDKVSGREGVVRVARFTPNSGGRSGTAGDYAIDFGAGGSGPVFVQDGAFLNAAGAKNEMSVAFWAKKYDTAAGSAFWMNSPSSNNGQRGYQAHVPWNNNQIYFDHAGCCDAPQRINAGIETLPTYSGELTWWNEWRFFVFSIKAGVKQIWVDGELFLEGTDAAPLPTDFTSLYIGSDGAGGGLFHALVDNFSVFSTQLSEGAVKELFAGASPSALPASAELLALWEFNDPPSDGQFFTVSPTPGTASAAPNLVEVTHLDGAVAWTQDNVTLTVDGQPAPVTVTRDGTTATVRHVPATFWAIQSSHTAVLTYPTPGGPKTLTWEFSVAPYTRDAVASRVGAFTGGSGYGKAAGGRSGVAGDYAVDFGNNGTGPVVVNDGAFMNTGATQDKMTFAIWAKKADIANSSVFWGVSPSSNNGQRGWQVHLPWSNNQIYFDTAGCCDPGQRINAEITTYANYSGEVTWWQDWHFFVFTKNAGLKQIWVDGNLFLEGTDSAPLPTDFTRLLIGSDSGGGGLFHGQVDDLSIYAAALEEADIKSLYTGTSPSALPSSLGLLAYWNFNDIPAGGIFQSFSPANGATDGVPNRVAVTHQQGSAAWDLSKVVLKVDGNTVEAQKTITDGRLVVSYVPSPIFAAKSSHTASLTYPDGAGTSTRDWQFTVASYTKDLVNQNVGVMTGAAVYTANGQGRSGQTGDFAMDFGRVQAGQSVTIDDVAFFNAAVADDIFSVGGWQKLHSIRDSAFVWGVSPSSNGSQRGLGTHTPWSNNNLYYDTAGCCNGDQRLSGPIDTFPDYSGATTWWEEWHHFVFLKNGATKEIWIDGKLFLSGENIMPMPTDFNRLIMAYNPADNGRLQGILDDVAFFSTALTEAQIGQWFSGTRPNALPAAVNLVAYWDFNDAPAERPTIAFTRSASGVVNVTFTGRLESSTSVAGGTWAEVPNATSGMVVPTTGPRSFYRSVR